MNRGELIKRIKELDTILVEEMDAGEITCYARERAHYGFEDLIEIIEENED